MDRQKSPMKREDVANYISRFPEFLDPIARVLGSIAESGAWLEEDSAVLLASYRPDIGPHVYDTIIFPPQTRSLLDTYQQIHSFPLPEPILEMLAHLNGGYIAGLAIYGVPTSMAQSPPLLDRSRRTPLDISHGRNWRLGYAYPQENEVLFASKNVGERGQIGYFVNPIGRVIGRGNDSEEVEKQSGPWDNLTDWLESELSQV